LNPSLSYRWNDRLSPGVGVDIMYMNDRLSRMIDFGSASGVSALAANPVADVFSEMNLDC